MSAKGRLRNERRSARGQGGARGELPRSRQTPEGIVGLPRVDTCQEPCVSKEGGEFKGNQRHEGRNGQSLQRRFILSAFDNGAGVLGAVVFVMVGIARSLGVRAAGKEIEAGGGFKQQAMRRDRQPEDGQQHG